MQGSDLAGDLEQLEYPYRPMTPGEEEIMRIYEDKVFWPPDMIERPGAVSRYRGSKFGDLLQAQHRNQLRI